MVPDLVSEEAPAPHGQAFGGAVSVIQRVGVMINRLARVKVVSPGEATLDERAAFESLVLRGAEVNAATLPGLVDRALCLAFVGLPGQLVGVGAMKQPYDSHRADVFTWAQSGLDPSAFRYELGWIFVLDAARGSGLASTIVESLVAELRGAKSYATSRVDNARMHSALRRFGYSEKGQPYPSRQSQEHIQLFVRE